MRHLRLMILRPGTKPDVYKNGFPSFKTQILSSILSKLIIIFIN